MTRECLETTSEYDKRTLTTTRSVRFSYSMSETNAVRKSQRELLRVNVVYQYSDVVLIHELALLMDFFERHASISNKFFLKLRSIVEFYHSKPANFCQFIVITTKSFLCSVETRSFI